MLWSVPGTNPDWGSEGARGASHQYQVKGWRESGEGGGGKEHTGRGMKISKYHAEKDLDDHLSNVKSICV